MPHAPCWFSNVLLPLLNCRAAAAAVLLLGQSITLL
jgi:hypothetical protein